MKLSDEIIKAHNIENIKNSNWNNISPESC
jgi:hypothetical protein